MLRRRHTEDAREGTSASDTSLKAATDPATLIAVTYLLVSPVLLPFTYSLLPPGAPKNIFAIRGDGEAESLFLKHPTFAIFGDSDSFTSSRRLRGWARRQSERFSHFEWEEIEGAGHFWNENDSLKALSRRIDAWVKCEGL